MGKCQKCGKQTKKHWYPLCDYHYYYDVKFYRFWVSLAIAIGLQFLPIIDGEGLMVYMMNVLFDETQYILFRIGAIVATLLVTWVALRGISVFLFSIGLKNST